MPAIEVAGSVETLLLYRFQLGWVQLMFDRHLQLRRCARRCEGSCLKRPPPQTRMLSMCQRQGMTQRHMSLASTRWAPLPPHQLASSVFLRCCPGAHYIGVARVSALHVALSGTCLGEAGPLHPLASVCKAVI